MAAAEHGQAAIITPFTLAGAMSPITIAGALAQQDGEALAVIAFTQMVRPARPVVFGGFTSNVDMKSGAPAFRHARVCARCDHRRADGAPLEPAYRSSNVTASNAPDAQAVMESMMSLWASILAHSNIIMHATGWLEGGLTTSYEKVVLDAEMIGAMRAWLSPLDLSDDALAFEAIAATPPGGHFFGAEHTMARFETAFHASMISDLRPFGTWEADGAKTATERANARWKALLASYRQPPTDPAVLEALDAFVAERKAAIGRHGSRGLLCPCSHRNVPREFVP
jgi:trimethylamine--corrinoid protein Co-methyltransferase